MALSGSLGAGGGQWILNGTTLEPVSSASGGTRIGSSVTNYSKTGDDATGDFENAGANISHDGTAWDNDVLVTDHVADNGSLHANSANWEGAVELSNLNDGNDGTLEYIRSGVEATFDVDLGSARTIDTVSIRFGSHATIGVGNACTVKVLYGASDDGSTFDTTVLDTTSTREVAPETASESITPVSKRYWRFSGISSGTDWFKIIDVTATESGRYSTGNTIETNVYTGAAASFAPGSLEVLDENDTNITSSGLCNVDYAINGGAYVGSLIDIVAFRALAASTFASKTQIDLKFQPVDEQFVKSINLDTTSTEVLIQPGGNVNIVENGVVTDRLNSTRTATAVSATTAGERFMAVTDTSTTRTITLATADVIDGHHKTIKDEGGQAGTNTLTIATEGSETIDGAATKTITTNYDSLSVYSDGTNWFTFSN